MRNTSSQRPRRRPSVKPSTVLASIALFVALGGSAFAAARITGADVENGSLSGRDVREAAVKVSRPSMTAIRVGAISDQSPPALP